MRFTFAAMPSAILLLGHLAIVASGRGGDGGGGGGAAATIELLLTDLSAASTIVSRDLRDKATGEAIRQLDVVPRGAGGFVGAHADGAGVALSVSTDLRSFARAGTFQHAGGATAPALAHVTGTAPDHQAWWVMAFETKRIRQPGAKTAGCDGYVVSGAGVRDVDGCYSRTKRADVFSKDPAHSIYPYNHSSELWHIGTEGKAAFYASLHPSAEPPNSPGGCGAIWAADKNHGAAPCPKVHRAGSPAPAPPPPNAPVTASIGFALFTSETALLSGNASRVFLAPNAPLLEAWGRAPVTPARCSSPTLYSAVYSRRGGQLTVDVVYGLAWTDSKNQSHPANALLVALSPDPSTQVSAPEHNAFFSFDGQGYVSAPSL